MGVITKGVTFAAGDTVTHLNIVDALTTGTVAGVGRSNVDTVNFSLFTRSSTDLPGPVDNEAQIHSLSSLVSTYDSASSRFTHALSNYMTITWKEAIFEPAPVGIIAMPTGFKSDSTTPNVTRAKTGPLFSRGVVGIVSESIAFDSKGTIQFSGSCFIRMKDAITRGQGIVTSSTDGQGAPAAATDARDKIIAVALETALAGALCWSHLYI